VAIAGSDFGNQGKRERKILNFFFYFFFPQNPVAFLFGIPHILGGVDRQDYCCIRGSMSSSVTFNTLLYKWLFVREGGLDCLLEPRCAFEKACVGLSVSLPGRLENSAAAAAANGLVLKESKGTGTLFGCEPQIPNSVPVNVHPNRKLSWVFSTPNPKALTNHILVCGAWEGGTYKVG